MKITTLLILAIIGFYVLVYCSIDSSTSCDKTTGWMDDTFTGFCHQTKFDVIGKKFIHGENP